MVEHIDDPIAGRDIPVGHQDTVDVNPTVGRRDGQRGSCERRERFGRNHRVIRPNSGVTPDDGWCSGSLPGQYAGMVPCQPGRLAWATAGRSLS